MVAYNFQPQFAPVILSGSKCSTIRPPRLGSHARPGQELQLYTGLRTKSIRLLMRVPCTHAESVEIHRAGARRVFSIGRREFGRVDLEQLVTSEGFGSLAEMIGWFEERYGLPTPVMVRIRWDPALARDLAIDIAGSA